MWLRRSMILSSSRLLKTRDSLGFLLLILPTITSAAVQEVGQSGIYLGIRDNAILLLLLSHATGFIIWLATTIWKSFLKDKDATETSVQNLNDSFSEFRGQTIEALHAIRSDIKVLSKLPSESEIMKRLEEKQELLIYKAVREMRSRD